MNLIFHSTKSQRRYLLVSLESNTSYVRIQIVLDLIELLSSFHSLTAKKNFEELDINNVCVLNIKA